MHSQIAPKNESSGWMWCTISHHISNVITLVSGKTHPAQTASICVTSRLELVRSGLPISLCLALLGERRLGLRRTRRWRDTLLGC
jgi:hypothetical protein